MENGRQSKRHESPSHKVNIHLLGIPREIFIKTVRREGNNHKKIKINFIGLKKEARLKGPLKCQIG